MFNILKNKFSIFDKSQKSSTIQPNSNVVLNEIEPDNDINDDVNGSAIRTNKSYHFLEDNYNPLSKIFGDFNDLTRSYRIHLCIYKINLECKTPFIQFLVNNTDIPSFPNIDDFVCQTVEDVEPNTIFMNKCIYEIVNILNIHNIFGVELLEKMYKGFVEQDDNIFVVFECLTELDHIATKITRWCILAEIIDDVKIDNKFMNPIMKSFLSQNLFMTEIFDINDNVYQNPIILYLCENGQDENEIIIGTTTRFIDTTMKHEWLGEYYFFTSDDSIIDISNSKTILQRYAVFTDNSKYVLSDISKINDNQKKVFLRNSSDSLVLSVYFHQGGKQYWYVKNNNNFTRI